MMDKYDEGQKKSLTPVVLAAARCCLSLSSMLSSSPALLGLASNSTSFKASFSTRPASTMASTSIRKRPRVRPSLKRPRWDKSEIFEKQNSFHVPAVHKCPFNRGRSFDRQSGWAKRMIKIIINIRPKATHL